MSQLGESGRAASAAQVKMALWPTWRLRGGSCPPLGHCTRSFSTDRHRREVRTAQAEAEAALAKPKDLNQQF
jgi:hypothetical protein